MAATQGAQQFMLMDDTGIDGNSEAYEFVSENLRLSTGIIDHNEECIRGTRSHFKERTSQGLKRVGGTIVMYPSPAELDNLLPRILGSNNSTDDFPVGEGPFPAAGVYIAINRGPAWHNYDGCVVARAIFSGRKGQRLKLAMDIVGVDESETLVSSPMGTGAGIDTDISMVFHEAALTVESGAREFNEFALVINNYVQVRFNNSQTATDISYRDRTVHLQANFPYTTSEDELYTNAAANIGGASATLVFTRSTQSTTFTFENLKAYAETPIVTGKTEVRHIQRFKSFATNSGGGSTTAEFNVTHTAT